MYKIFEDETCVLTLTPHEGQFYFGAELLSPDRKVGTIRHWLRVFSAIQHNLKERGLTEIFAVVSSQDRFDFADFFGFKTTGVSFNNEFEVVRKELL